MAKRDTNATVRAAVGRLGEDVAVRYLQRTGCEVLARNWRCRVGEIDVVVRDGSVLVVCEVKTRRGTGFGGPLEAVTAAKAARLRRLSVAYLEHVGLRGVPLRIDLIGVLLPPRGAPVLEHLRGVA